VLSAALLAAGVGPRWCAAICFIIAVSVQRWNFLVYYADDMVIQLILFWLMFLPTGTTLHLGRWRRRLPDAWRETHVPALQLKLFLANVLLVYLVAGITKLTSPMWLSGTALYAILKLPFARAPDFWGSEMLPLLRVLNYAALATEITIPGECRGPCHVRLLVANQQAHALGSANIYVRPAPVAETAQTDGAIGR
jgi:hypothetical protein